MKHSIYMGAFTLAAAATAATLAGCASNAPSAPVTYSSQPSAAAAYYGTVDNIQLVRAGGGTSGAGAVTGGLVGALLGNQVGSGSGRTAATVAGAVGGALVGNKVENDRNQPHDTYQISVRMDNGDYRVLQQDDIADMRVGSRVRLVDGHLVRY
ncbi:MAG: glycine zipper 2TM domain-containing protein [Pseudomonadota bacterium]